MTDKERLLVEGALLESLVAHEGWAILMAKLKDKDESIEKMTCGIMRDLSHVNYHNGWRHGLKEPLRVIEKAINQRKAELAKEDSAGG